MVCLVCVDALRITFWVITKCYNWWSGMREMHPQPLSLFFSRPNRSEPSYPQGSCSTCPQFAVDNLPSTNKVFKYLWISLRQLNIMVIVLSRIGKTLGFGRFCMGGEGVGLAVIIVGAPHPPKKRNGLQLAKPSFPKGKKWNSPLQLKRERKSLVVPRVRSR
jgi:hypothetical protein